MKLLLLVQPVRSFIPCDCPVFGYVGQDIKIYIDIGQNIILDKVTYYIGKSYILYWTKLHIILDKVTLDSKINKNILDIMLY